MPDAYEVQEARFLQWATSLSAAGALTVLSTFGVPKGKIWTVLGAAYYPSVAETRTVCFGVYHNGQVYPVTLAEQWPYVGNTNLGLALVREGLELKLWPEDYLFVARDAATAGSTMALNFRYIETDLPLYTYIEPQLRKRQAGALSTIRSAIGVIGGGRGIGGGERGPEGGGGRRSLPK